MPLRGKRAIHSLYCQKNPQIKSSAEGKKSVSITDSTHQIECGSHKALKKVSVSLIALDESN